MKVICDGHKGGCNHDGCAHIVEHKQRSNCDVTCRRFVNGKLVKFGVCKKTDIIDVDELFEDIEL